MNTRKIFLVLSAAVVALTLSVGSPANASSLGDILRNVGHDAGCACFGPNNDLVRILRDGPPGRLVEGVQHDVQHGPGPTNDLVGRKGWVRQRLGF
jgi:hypothetical protein